MSEKKEASSKTHKILTVVGIILCVILIPILIVNCTLIIKSFISQDVPSFAGIIPQIVLTDSMANPDEPNSMYSGDLIICKVVDPEDIKVGDTISFFDPAGNGVSVVTHTVVEIVGETWKTKGSNNNTEDKEAVPFSKLVGKYIGIRIPKAGNVAMFMKTTPGLIVCVVIPLVLFIGYDIIRRRLYEKKNQTDTDELLAELAALKAEKAKAEEQQNSSNKE